VLRLGRALRPIVVVPTVVLAAAGLAGFYAARSVNWAVMTDELQVARLATSIADTLSPVPQIHGVYYGALSQLYPLLLSPLFGVLDPPTAVRAAHVLNALLLPSAAVPAFLLGRSVSGSRAAGYAAAALTVFTPWLILTSTLLTENVAYPAFVWAVYFCHRTLTRPSRNADALALVGLVLAFLARTQFVVLALALPLVVLCHEAGFALSARGRRRSALATGVRTAVLSHPLLTLAYAIAAVAAGAVALFGSLGAFVGNYSVSLDGGPFPPGIWKSAAAHLDHIVIGVGILPFLLSAAWALLSLVRAKRKEAHGFAVLFVILVPLLTIEVASFDLRFTPGGFVQDRYLFYLAPLFAVGSGAMLVERTFPLARIGLVAAIAILFAWLVTYAGLGEDKVLFWAAPAAAFHPALERAAGWMSLTSVGLVRCVIVALAVVVIALLARAPRTAVWVTVAVAAFGAFEAGYVFHRFSDPVLTRASTPAGYARNWIDRAVDGGAPVALVPSPHDGPTSWWDAEYWNKNVTHLLRVDGGRTYSPFPKEDVSIDYTRGTLRGSQPSEFLVVSPKESRFHLLAKPVVDARSLQLVQARRPYRLTWATRGLTPDGWKRADRPMKLRLYGDGRGGNRTVVLTLSSSRHAALPLSFTFESGAASRRGSVDPGGARPPVSLRMCVPARGHADATLRATGAVRIPDGRLVSVHVERIEVKPRPGGCAR
jgi:hypothetical protein